MGCLPTEVHRHEGWWCKHSAACLEEASLWGRRTIRALRCCWSWTDCDLANLAGKWSQGTQCQRQEREDQQREVQNLHFWHSPSLVTTLNGHRGCTDARVQLRSRIAPHLFEFPLSWTGPGWKGISTLLLLQPWKEGSGDNACAKAETWTAAVITGRCRESSPFPAQPHLLLQTMVAQKPCYCKIPGIGGREQR